MGAVREPWSVPASGDPLPLARHWAFWMACLTAAVLRAWGLSRQVLLGDEMHAFQWALELEFPEVLVALPFTANSPPMNAGLRLLLDLGLQPSEAVFRVFMLACGLALVVWLPLWAGRRLGHRAGIALAWLLALSPALVYHSRFMRPYAPFALFTAIAVIAFYEWWERGSRGAGALYAVAAALAAYVHILALPIVLAPWALAALDRARGARAGRPADGAALRVLGGTAGLLSLYLVPAWPHLWKLAASRRQPTQATWGDVLDAAIVLLGTPERVWPVVIALALTVYGLTRLWKRDPRLVGYLGVLVAVHAVAVPTLSQTFIGNPLILARYLLPLWVLCLVFLALGVSALLTRLPHRVVAPAGAALAASLFVLGPLDDLQVFRGSLGLQTEILAPWPENLRFDAPPAYAELPTAERGPLIEFPSRPARRFATPLAHYERVHGRRVLLSPGNAALADPRYALHSIVAPKPEAFVASEAAWLAVHLDWRRELGPLLGFGPATHSEKGLERARRDSVQLRRMAAGMRRRLTRQWGPPDIESELVVLWDLDAVRRRLAAGEGGGARSKRAGPS